MDGCACVCVCDAARPSWDPAGCGVRLEDGGRTRESGLGTQRSLLWPLLGCLTCCGSHGQWSVSLARPLSLSLSRSASIPPALILSSSCPGHHPCLSDSSRLVALQDNPEDWELKIESVQSDRARAYMRWIRRQSPELQAEIQEAMKQNEEDRERFEKGDYVSAELAGQKISTLFASMGLKTINFIENPFDDRIEQRFRRRFER